MWKRSKDNLSCVELAEGTTSAESSGLATCWLLAAWLRCICAKFAFEE